MKVLAALQVLYPAARPQPAYGLFVDPSFRPAEVPPEQRSPAQHFAACLLQTQTPTFSPAPRARSQHG